MKNGKPPPVLLFRCKELQFTISCAHAITDIVNSAIVRGYTRKTSKVNTLL